MKTRKLLRKATLCFLVTVMLLPVSPAMALAEEKYISSVGSFDSLIEYRYAYSGTGTVNLYQYASDAVESTIPDGAKIALHTAMTERGRSFVKFGSLSGWINDSEMRTSPPKDLAVLEPDEANFQYIVRDTGRRDDTAKWTKDFEGKVDLGDLAAGTLVAVYEIKGGKAFISFGEGEGWVSAYHLSSSADTDERKPGSGGKADQAAIPEPGEPAESVNESSQSTNNEKVQTEPSPSVAPESTAAPAVQP